MTEALTAPPRPNTCPHCRASVIWARIRDGRSYRPVALERCTDGRGDMAFFPSLFADTLAPIAEVVCNGTSYRRHAPSCPGPLSHSLPFNQRLKST